MPLFARRRFPFGAPATVGVVFAAGSFVDDRVTPSGLVPVLTAFAVFVLFGLLRNRTQAIAGLALGIGVAAIISHNDPKGGIGNFVFSSIAFTIAWADRLRGSGASSTRRRRRRSDSPAPSGRGSSRPGSPSRMSARGSRASCTTWSVTASAS